MIWSVCRGRVCKDGRAASAIAVVAELERLQAIVDAAWLVHTEDKDQTPCPDYGLRVAYRGRLDTLLDAWKAAEETKRKRGA